jgi:hypothetical protein
LSPLLVWIYTAWVDVRIVLSLLSGSWMILK